MFNKNDSLAQYYIKRNNKYFIFKWEVVMVSKSINNEIKEIVLDRFTNENRALEYLEYLTYKN